MAHILITGSTGFVGRHLSHSLSQQGHTIYGLNRTPSEEEEVLKRAFTWDKFGEEEVRGIDTVIHLAGKAHDLQNTSSPEKYFEINTALTIRLFTLFLKSSARDFFYFSSVKAAADRVEGALDEGHHPDPQTPYGQSKRKAEEYLLARALPEGKRVLILRPCMIHGPGNKGNLNALYKVVNKGIPYPLAAFSNRRSFLSIENLKFVVKRLVEEKTVKGGIYHLADDEPLSTSELIRIIGEASGRKVRLWSLSPAMIKKFAALGDVFRLPLNSERLKKLTESYVVDNRKIKKALQVEAFPVSSREGLRDTIRSFGKGGAGS